MMLVILTMIILLIFTVYILNNNKVNGKKKNNNKNILENKKTNIKLYSKINKKELTKSDYTYYIPKKKVRFYDEPIVNRCNQADNPEDKFINEYVWKSKLFCDNSEPNELNELSEFDLAKYRDKVFDFNSHINRDSNGDMFTPVDNINEYILNNPDMTDKSIAEVYDELTRQKYNSEYTNLYANGVQPAFTE
jgi:hypothetical protein